MKHRLGAKTFEALEDMIDQYGLKDVIEALATIASEKADHVLTNWQDKELAKRWGHISEELIKFASRKEEDIPE